ncbi:MAG TPA: chemotaxis protein CheW [Rhodocyclaceae bacterium]|nr:chemotaxis protein CheW [Rhodocyclaceae bacterium]
MGDVTTRTTSDSAVIAHEAPRQCLTFDLGGEMYAVAISNVKEIIEYGTLTDIPMMPPFIRGVINLRGRVVPVVDLLARFGGCPADVGRRSCIIILELHEKDAHQDIGVMVDAVNEVLEIPASDIEPPPAFGARIRADFIEGMARVAGKFIVLLNIGHVLSVDEMGALADIQSEAANLAAKHPTQE